MSLTPEAAPATNTPGMLVAPGFTSSSGSPTQPKSSSFSSPSANRWAASSLGRDAHREDDHVVLRLGEGAGLDVLVLEDEVAVLLLGDAGHAALHEVGAHALGLLVELVVALAGGADVHVVDGDVGQRQGAHDQLVVLDGVHAADARAHRVAEGLVAGSGAQDEGDVVGDLAVARADHPVVGAGGGEQAVHLHAGDDVLVLAEAVLRLEFGREEGVAGGEHDRAYLGLDAPAPSCSGRCSRPGRCPHRSCTRSRRRSRGSGWRTNSASSSVSVCSSG